MKCFSSLFKMHALTENRIRAWRVEGEKSTSETSMHALSQTAKKSETPGREPEILTTTPYESGERHIFGTSCHD